MIEYKYRWWLVKKILYFVVFILLFSLTFYYKEDILIYYNKYLSNAKQVPTSLEKNEYYRNYNFKYVTNTDNFSPNTKQDILNIYYTIINSGMENFTFYCPDTYDTCLDDVKDVAYNKTVLSNINDFVHPYNSFSQIETSFDSLGEINIKIIHNYTEEMKIILDYKVDEIIKKELNEEMEIIDKIKIIHDYIINNTKYDQNRSDKNIFEYKSNNAYGVLIEGYGICSGYTDSMMLFLEKLNIKSYKVSSENHVWNKVFVNNNWYNLDLTWDDPVNSDGSDSLEHNFFLVTDDEMLKNDKTEHTYNEDVYEN